MAVSTVAELLFAGRGLMDATARETARQDSKATPVSSEDSGIPGWLGWVLFALGVAGSVLLIVAEFSTLYDVKAVTAVIKRQSGHAQHSYALLVIGLLGLPMAWGAVRGASRPAMLGLAALGLITVLIALVNDLPDVNGKGNLARTFEEAEASPASGFYFETLGAALMLISAVGMLVLTAPGRLGERFAGVRLPRLPRRSRPSQPAAETPAPAGEAPTDRAGRTEEERLAAARARAEAREQAEERARARGRGSRDEG